MDTYDPAQVVILNQADTDLDTVVRLAADNPVNIHIIEGQHMGISLPNEYWAQLDSPTGLVALLDEVYGVHNDYMGNANPPYDGDIIWFVPEDVDDAGWYMHAGNPIVYRHYAAREIVDQFNSERRLGWGIVHELGHDMHISSCGINMIPDGTGRTGPMSGVSGPIMRWTGPQHERYSPRGQSLSRQS